MNTPCKDIQEKLLQEIPLQTDQRDHLKDCRDCQSFADLLTHLPLLDEDNEPPASIDAAILGAAQRRHTQPRLVLLKPLLLATAAAVVLAFGLWFIQSPDQPTSQPPRLADERLQPEQSAPTVAETVDPMLAWDFNVFDDRLMELEAELVMMDQVAAPSDTMDQVL